MSKSTLTLISLAASITLNVYLVHRVNEELENNDSLFNEASNYLAFLVPKLQEEDMIAFAKKIKLDEEFYKIVGEYFIRRNNTGNSEKVKLRKEE